MSASPLDADASTFAGSFATAWKSVMAQASKLASARSWRRDDGQGESALAAASLDQSAGLSPPKRTAPESAIRAGRRFGLRPPSFTRPASWVGFEVFTVVCLRFA